MFSVFDVKSTYAKNKRKRKRNQPCKMCLIVFVQFSKCDLGTRLSSGEEGCFGKISREREASGEKKKNRVR